MRSERKPGLGLGVALLALVSGCQFYTTVSGPGDLGFDCNIDKALPLEWDAASASVPVVVLVHGYSATTYETGPAAEYLTKNGYLVSRPMLGAHGTTVREFGQSTWQQWAAPVAADYNRLTAAGYRNVSFLTYSTGGTLTMELLAEGKLTPPPRRISMVAPILDFADKLSGAAGLLKALGASNSPSRQTGSSKCHWYSDRPIDAVLQLIDLTEVMKGRLRAGTMRVPDDARIQIYQSTRDKTVDPLSAQLWASYVKGGLVSVTMVDTDIHVPIGPDAVGTDRDWTDADRALRDRILEQVAVAHKN